MSLFLLEKRSKRNWFGGSKEEEVPWEEWRIDVDSAVGVTERGMGLIQLIILFNSPRLTYLVFFSAQNEPSSTRSHAPSSRPSYWTRFGS
jgi:hypothetical protein